MMNIFLLKRNKLCLTKTFWIRMVVAVSRRRLAMNNELQATGSPTGVGSCHKFLPINLVCLLLIMFHCAFAVKAFSQGAGSPEVGMIKACAGKVWIHRAGKKEEAKKTMELKEGDFLEIEDQSGATIIYFKGGKKEEYTSKAFIEIGIEKSAVREGQLPTTLELQKKKITIDKQELIPVSTDKDIALAGGQFIRGILPPKQYFENSRIQRYAVVIGISEYKDPKIPDLKFADKDAQAFYEFITSSIGGAFNKENVLLLKNEQATLKNVKSAVTQFLKKAIDSDFVVIFIAGHGEPEPDRPSNLYLLMHDTELDNLSATAYHMENVNADMKRYISAKRLVFFADACHSAGVTEGTVGTRGFSNTISVALSTLKSTREGWGVVSASRAGEVSMESGQWGGGHGAFTYYLLEGLKGKADAEGNKNGIVTLAEAFDFLEDKVKRATQNAQHPDTAGNFDNNLPLGFPGVDAQPQGKEQTASAPRSGALQINTIPDGATVYVNGKEMGITPLSVKLISGTYPITLKKKDCADVQETIFVNPDETTDVHIELISAEGRQIAQAKSDTPDQTGIPQSSGKEEIKEAKDNIDALVKELEAMSEKQSKGKKTKPSQKIARKEKPQLTDVPTVVPISLKDFNVKMGALSNSWNMKKLRQKIIDALIVQKGLRVVERDLEMHEDVLREQRLSSSILANDLFRTELGNIQGAAFLCYGGVSQGDEPHQLVLRMEIIETETTLIDTFEYPFQENENLKFVAGEVAAKMREKIASKRKL